MISNNHNFRLKIRGFSRFAISDIRTDFRLSCHGKRRVLNKAEIPDDLILILFDFEQVITK